MSDGVDLYGFQCMMVVWLIKHANSVKWRMLGLGTGGRVVSGGW